MSVQFEIIIKGDRDIVRAYLSGLFIGKGIKRGYVFTEDHPFNFQSIKERFKYRGEIVHIVCNAQIRTTITKAIEKAPTDLCISVIEVDKVTRGYFHFEFETANRSVAGRIKRLLAKLPKGVRLTDYDENEIVNPAAKGPEGYAPLHAYDFNGAGVVEGNVQSVYEMHQKMDANDFIDVEDIELHH